MVAVIKFGKSVQKTLNYNENKVREGVAKCLAAVNYPKELEDLTLMQKLSRLNKLAALHEDVTSPSVHVSLNFPPGEHPDEVTMQKIAKTYMDKIGMGDQPYLVYEHMDAGHPHLHIVSVKVRADGTRVNTQNIGKNQSREARLFIEKEYGLTPAQQHGALHRDESDALNSEVLQMGKTAVKRKIENILHRVLDRYHYTSLDEFNALLSRYNVRSERGTENSNIYKHGGLIFKGLKDGQPAGPPLKASLFNIDDQSPTLTNLQSRFEANKRYHKSNVKERDDLANRIRITIAQAKKLDLPDLIARLREKRIAVALHVGKDDRVFGITFIDHANKNVFKGSDLGKDLTAAAIIKKCGMAIENPGNVNSISEPSALSNATLQPSVSKPSESQTNAPATHPRDPSNDTGYFPPLGPATGSDVIFVVKGIFDALTQNEYTPLLPYPFRIGKSRKKKKRKSI
ncbi:relaxase/mobilization nuclease domain-containing protein [Chitinophaga sancti]|uniref:Relaxase/Mobilisation nuclease domain-containing protein n=1 Tax=Chitinophaga sancti TaxID=1004 RepID=A0A1K1SSW9_9BACT|nr:relaxase/mobilization nuclease domain-containing protein [Chitinophaga sancti]WQD65397.1 relaxase/mobilization nuclease domain-containing protein [Chitinophaga sancti]WQG88979.1 relaxase/mobilization nuclease domain-containing protein [Chitinophaga sancti]SFW87402.1 Relaxase/Mobilisation nuclease domain-containing protein [Chitinophaga sancti]